METQASSSTSRAILVSRRLLRPYSMSGPVASGSRTAANGAQSNGAARERNLPIVFPGAANVNGASNRGASGSNRPVVRPSGGGSVILVNPNQKGNPIINAGIRGIGWEYSDIMCDYQVGATTGVLYLSLKYHRLHPEYIDKRISKLGEAYSLRILLVMCDVDDSENTLKELTKRAIVNNYTMMVAWSNEEAGRYLEIYKQFENRAPDSIKERVEKDYMSQATAVLTTVKGINKTDVVTLLSTFGSIEKIATATADELVECPGMGEKKVKRLREAMTRSFVARKRPSNAAKRAEVGPDLN